MKRAENGIPICEEHALHLEHIEAARSEMPEEEVLCELSDFFKIFSCIASGVQFPKYPVYINTK